MTLAASHIGLALHLARPYAGRRPDLAPDLYGAALLGLVQAAARFNPGRGVLFSTYARRRVLGSILHCLATEDTAGLTWGRGVAIRGRHPRRRVGSLECLADRRSPPSDLEERESFEAILRLVSPKRAAVLRQIYLHGQTEQEAGRTLGCSQSVVSGLHGAALRKLFDLFQREPARWAHLIPRRSSHDSGNILPGRRRVHARRPDQRPPVGPVLGQLQEGLEPAHRESHDSG